MIHDDFSVAGKAMLSNALDISYNDEGKAIFTFTHNGEKVADSIEGFKGWAAENPDYKAILKGVDSSGAGARQSSSGVTSAQGVDGVQARLGQRLRAKGIQ